MTKDFQISFYLLSIYISIQKIMLLLEVSWFKNLKVWLTTNIFNYNQLNIYKPPFVFLETTDWPSKQTIRPCLFATMISIFNFDHKIFTYNENWNFNKTMFFLLEPDCNCSLTYNSYFSPIMNPHSLLGLSQLGPSI